MDRKTIFILSAVVLIIVAIAFYRSGFWKKQGSSTVRVGAKTFTVDIANTPFLRSKGLSGRESLADNEGMFFIFDSPGDYGFWMKGMKFPIDIIWILGNKVVSYEENVQPEPEKSLFSFTTYHPPTKIDRVLEINGGLVEKYGIRVGDKAVFEDL